MIKSIIDVWYKNQIGQALNDIAEAACNLGINVDKEQLEKAIYDALGLGSDGYKTGKLEDVVRCKDCKYFKYGDYCDQDKMEHSRCREDDFCSYAEPKGRDEE